MLYNKSQLNKTSDKKLMRKVKSKWVVVSTAAFAAGGFALASQGADAHADTVNNASQSQTTQQSTTNSTNQTAQQNTAPTLASNDLTQGQVTGTANAGNTVATGTYNDSNDQVLNGQSLANVTSQSAAIKYDGFTNTRAQDVDPIHYNANDSNSTSQAYRQGSNDYNDYRYGIVGDLQTPGNNGSGNSWGTQRNTSWNAAYKYQQDKQNNSVQSDSSMQSQSSVSVNGGYGTMPVSGYTSKLYTAAYIDAKHIDENETAKGEYRARNELSRPDDSNVTNLATSWNTNNSQGYNYDQNDANRTYNAFNQALTNPDSSKDYIGISSQVYDIYKLAAQKAEAGITDENALDAAYQTLVSGYNKYLGSGFQAGMPVTIQTQPQTRSQNPVWADGTQYGLGVNAGIADAKAKKAMTLGTDVNYNAGYTNAFNGYNNGVSDAIRDYSFNTPINGQTVSTNHAIPWMNRHSNVTYPDGYAAGFNDTGVEFFNGYTKGIQDVVNNISTNMFTTGLSDADYQGKPLGWAEGVDSVLHYWNSKINNSSIVSKVMISPSHDVSDSQFLNWAILMSNMGFGTLFSNYVDSIQAKANAFDWYNTQGLYTSTDGKSLTMTATPNSKLNPEFLKVFDSVIQSSMSGNTVMANGLLNQAAVNVAQRFSTDISDYNPYYNYSDTPDESLIGSLVNGYGLMNQVITGHIDTGSTPDTALRLAYACSIAKGYTDASKGVNNPSSASSQPYELGQEAYADVSIAIANAFGSNQSPANNDTIVYNKVSDAVNANLPSVTLNLFSTNYPGTAGFPNSNIAYAGGDMGKLVSYMHSIVQVNPFATASTHNGFSSDIKAMMDKFGYTDPYYLAKLISDWSNKNIYAVTKPGISVQLIGNNNSIQGTPQVFSSGINTMYQDYKDMIGFAITQGLSGESVSLATPAADDKIGTLIYNDVMNAYTYGKNVRAGVRDASNGINYTAEDNMTAEQYNANLAAQVYLKSVGPNSNLFGQSMIQTLNISSGGNMDFPLNNPQDGKVYSFISKPDANDTLGAFLGARLTSAAIMFNNSGQYMFALNLPKTTTLGNNLSFNWAHAAFDNAASGLNMFGAADTISSWSPLFSIQSAGTQAWADAQSGIAYVQANAKVPTDGSTAYQVAAQAYYDAYMGAKPTSNGALYLDVYNSSQQNEGTMYATGVRHAVQPGIGFSGGNALQTNMFNLGTTDGQAAYAAAMKADATMPSTFTPIQQAGFQGVRDAIYNYFASPNDRVSTGKFQGVGNGDQNDVYQAFYNYAQANLKSTKDLITQFQGSDDTDSDATDLHAYFNVYQNYMKGFNAGETNAANPNANDTFINAGYNDGVKVYNAVQDFLQSPVGNDQLTEAAADAMFDVENQSSTPRTYGSRLQREAYRLTHDALTTVAQKVVSDFQNPTGAVSYVGADAKSQVSQVVYNHLRDAFNGVDQGNFTSTGQYSAEGIQAYQKLLSVAQSSIDHPSSSSAQTGNNLVWQAVQDALNGTAQRANQGLAYDTFYNMAKKIKDNQDAQAKAQADAAQADADRDAANKRADQSDANAKQADADKTAAQQAQSQAETDKANAQKAQADAEAKAQQADAQRDAAIKAQQQAEADKAQADSDRDNAIKAQQQADADRDAANKRADQSDANAKQADADKAQAEQDKANALAQAAQAEAAKAKAEQAQAQAQSAQADAEAKRDAAIKAQQQAEAARDDAIKAQQAAQAQSQSDGADKAQAEVDKANAIEAQQRAENARDAAVKAQQDAEAQRDDAVKAQQQAEADKNAALQAQKAAEDKAAQATDAMNKADAERDAANAANQQAQADKATAQKAQADAEATAKQAEQDKAKAQTAMQQAIADRDKAVGDRDNAIKQMNDAIADANQKVADAQKAESDAEAQVKVAQAAQADAQRRADEATAEAATAKKIADDAVIGKQDADARAQKATDDMNKAIADRDAAQAETQKATDAMNDAIKAKNDAIAQAQQANADKQAAINKANADIADANQRIANAIQAQTDAQAKAQQAQKDADAARERASQDVADANAKAQAEIDKAKAQAQADIDKAKSEAQAEVTKAQSDNSKSDAVRKADEARELREAEHQQKVNYKHGYELAFADARNGRMKPETFLTREDQFFVRGYEQGFMAYMNKHMPRYVSNKADIHIYAGDTFTTKNRGKLVDTKHAKNFRVYGVTFNKFGHIRYSIGNGKFITANRKFVVPTYFAPTNKAKNIKVRLGRTILVHKNKGFSDRKHLRVLHSGDVIHVRRVIKFHGITRLVVKGGYITSNRLFVKLAK